MGLTFEVSDLHHAPAPFAGGGESNLYNLPTDFAINGQRGPFVFKEYNQLVKDRSKGPLNYQLDVIVSAYKRMTSTVREKVIDQYAAWPLAVVTKDGDAIGVVMRKFCGEFVGESTGKTKIEVLEKWLWPAVKAKRKMVELGLNPLTSERKKDLVLKILAYYSQVHLLHWVVGDISFGNIMAFVPDGAAKPKPLFFEIDTYRKADSQLNTQQRDTPGWIAPETKRAKLAYHAERETGANFQKLAGLQAKAQLKTQASDVWKVGLLVLRLYDESPLPTQAQLNPDNLASVKSAFGDSAIAVLSGAEDDNPQNRPSMHDLTVAFLRGR